MQTVLYLVSTICVAPLNCLVSTMFQALVNYSVFKIGLALINCQVSTFCLALMNCQVSTICQFGGVLCVSACGPGPPPHCQTLAPQTGCVAPDAAFYGVNNSDITVR